MVCIYCSGKTHISNSRPQKRLMATWRRRSCQTCGAVFTTHETVDLSAGLAVRTKDGHLEPFSRDILFMSIVGPLGHREQPVQDASALTATIIAKLVRANTGAVIPQSALITITAETLRAFDSAASVQYNAYHPQPHPLKTTES